MSVLISAQLRTRWGCALGLQSPSSVHSFLPVLCPVNSGTLSITALTQPAHQAPHGFPLPRLPGDPRRVAGWGNPRDDLVYFPLHRDRRPSLPGVLFYKQLFHTFCLACGCLRWEGKSSPCCTILTPSWSLDFGDRPWDALWDLSQTQSVLRLWEQTQALSAHYSFEKWFGLLPALIDYISDHRITHDLATTVTHHD